MFVRGSRYAAVAVYTVVDRRGRAVTVVAVGPVPQQTTLGVHHLIEGQRLDHLAHLYLRNATAFWRIAEENGVMLAESLSEASAIRIPRP